MFSVAVVLQELNLPEIFSFIAEVDLSLFIYLIPYILLFFAKIENEKEIIGLNNFIVGIYVCVILFFILALRFNVGFDYGEYRNLYLSSTFDRFEPISRLVFIVASNLGRFEFLFVFFALLTITPIWLSFLKQKKISILIVYISLPFFYLESFSIIRQAASLSFCILGYAYFIERDKKAMLFFFIAVGLHYSAVVFLVYTIMLWCDSSKVKMLVLFALSMLVFLISPIFDYLLQHFPTLFFYQSGTSFGVNSLLLVCFIFLLSLNKFDSVEHYYIIFCGIIVNLMLLNFDSVLTRMAWFFYIPLIFLRWSHLFYVVKVNSVIAFSLMLLSVAIYLYTIYLKSQFTHGPLVPYYSIIQS